ncbi:amino acid adenylation domain-containing protein [Bailinhaonella thermotolerans]|uniref:Amino acid adenylation domain-containing protein n=2 Tax=Bailinhaonella thermotolerans TaxID=1070861 RepID=A0A3A4AYT8_9ACTN|nr:amino acid adenylation domain-containing protein [Bailinhaonella thermotolerans]
MTAAQAGIWAGQRLDPASPAYNAAEYVEIPGAVDPWLFESAVRLALTEAEALHARFDGEAQVLDVGADWPFHRLDVPDREAAEEWMRADLAVPADLARGPVFTQALLTAPDRVFWYQRIHHIAADGYSFSLIARRVAATYSALLRNEHPGPGFGPLGPVVREDAAYRDSERFARDRDFWVERCAGRAEPVTLAPPGPASHPAIRRTAPLPADLAATRGRASWGDLVIAAVAALLHRETGAGEVTLGLPVMGRMGSAALRVPCMAMNIVPLRIPVDPAGTPRALALRVAAELRATRPHHRYRYEDLRRDLGLVGGDRRLFGPVVNIMPFDDELRFGDARGVVHRLSAGPVEDLSVGVRPDGAGGLRLDLEANPAAYRDEDLAAVERGLLDLLADPDGPVTRPVVLSGGPLREPARPVLDLIAARPAGATALVHAGRAVTYGELRAAAGDFAGRLAGAGVRPGDLVALRHPRGVEAVTAILGTLAAGAAYLPLDPDGPASRERDILADARPSLLSTPGGLRPLPDPADPLDPDRGTPDAGDGLAYVIYTSGSTGTPKGVAVGRRALANFVAGARERYAITERDMVLQFAPLHFDASVEEIFVTLCSGGTLVIRTGEMLESIPRLLAACDEAGVTVLDLPTAYWHELAYAVSTGAARLPGRLRLVIIGGEAVLPERVARWHEAVGGAVTLLNTYGPTEGTVVATAAELTPGDPEITIGAPLPGVRVAVAGGELWLLGAGLARGYLGNPALTAERFPAVAALGGERAYRTGDRVRPRPDGRLVYLGRMDDEFKISGHRVDPAEVENALLSHPSVREAAVVGRTGLGGAKRLVAHVVAEDGLEVAALREHARERLPAAVVPSAYVLAERLPRTPSGKIDRSALRETAAEAAGTPAAGDAGVAANGLERLILRIWAEVLGPGAYGPSDDFFELGGQSLQTIQVANRLGVELGREVPAATVFRHPTPAALAHALGPRPAEPYAGGSRAREPYVEDAELPGGLVPPAVRAARPAGRVLLTGATGFVGAHLLAELAATGARVVCPVRAGDERAARERIGAALGGYGLRVPPDLVEAVPADLADPSDLAGLPGRAGEVDAVFHAAATVSLLRPYGSVRRANVIATRELLRAALAGGVPFHHVSTVAVGAWREDFVGPHDGLRDGYQQSKWAAEHLVRQAGERGLPVAAYRLGRVVGPTATGYVNPQDIVWRILRTAVEAGAIPDLPVAEPWTPVDHVARVLVRLALGGATGVFNVVPAEPVRFADVAAWTREYGYRLDPLPLPAWRRRLESSGIDPATLAFFDLHAAPAADPVPADVIPADAIPADRLARELPGAAFPEIGRDAVHAYLDHCVKTGLLPHPSPGAGETSRDGAR